MRKVKFNDPGMMAKTVGGPKRLKFERGDKAVLRILGDPVIVRSHFVEETGRGFGCSMEFSEKRKAYAGKCPLCESGNRASERFAIKVLEVQRGQEKVGKYRLWTIGLERFQTLSGIVEESGKDIKELDLIVGCTDAKYQKLTIIPATKRRECKPDADSDFDLDKACETPEYAALASQCGLGGAAQDGDGDEVSPATRAKVAEEEADEEYDIADLLNDEK